MLEYFEMEEFACRCGCGLNNFDAVTAERLDAARGYAGVPFALNSACRCRANNEAAGGSSTSSHLAEDRPATAVDIRATSSMGRFKIIQGLIKAGINRIGIGEDFVHADLDLSKARDVLWLY